MKKLLCLILLSALLFNSCRKKDKETIASSISPSDFLTSAKYQRLTIELVYDQGFPPAPETVTAIQNFLTTRINKPAGVNIVNKELNRGSKSSLSVSELVQIEKDVRTYYPSDNSLTAFVYLVNSEYAANSGNHKVLGVQYEATSIALFGKTLREFSGTIGKPSYKTLETSVALHEFGHVLGLVNNGTNMALNHQDNANGHHCNNKDCLMYYAVETSEIISNLLGGTVPSLDANCSNDLKANGGK